LTITIVAPDLQRHYRLSKSGSAFNSRHNYNLCKIADIKNQFRRTTMKNRLFTILTLLTVILALMAPLMAQNIDPSKMKIKFVKVPMECKGTNQQSDVSNELALTNREPNALAANTKIYWNTSYGTKGVVTLPEPLGSRRTLRILDPAAGGNRECTCEAYYLKAESAK
jgi:hypothetical protein